MAPSAPKNRYYHAEFFLRNFFRKIDFFGSRQMLYRSLIRVIFGTPVGTPKKYVSKIAYEADANFRHTFKAFCRTDIKQTNKQTRTSYLGTGVAD